MKALFGCWTSSSRKAVLPVLEKYNIPLFYPVQYEGCEKFPFIFSIADYEVKKIDIGYVFSDYTCWNYYQTIDTVQNKKFVPFI